MSSPRRALIAGLGLIGGSIGIALRERGWRVAYLDPVVDDPGGAADERVDSLDANAEIVIVATPVDAAIEIVAESGGMAAALHSVCSVMAPLRAVAGENFVAGHPVAGSEQHGLAAARGDLFRGKAWFVDRDDAIVEEVIAACGARMERVDAGEHDRAVALTSHLPQLLSTALAASMRDEDLRFAGSGLRTFLRLAASDAGVWMPVFAANRENVQASLDSVLRIAAKILDGDGAAFARAQELMEKLAR